jgi:hypothetical protein
MKQLESRTFVWRSGVRWLSAMALLGGVVMLAGPVDFRHDDLRVSANHRFLEHADGTPFFYLGDTAWELFHRLTNDEAVKYLDDRASKGFTVIQAVVLAEFDELGTPNVEAQRPFTDNDPGKPNEAYFRHVDRIVELARERGLIIGMLPAWGDNVVKVRGPGPAIFTAENARAYGRFLGSRYRSAPNILWILGGDRDPAGVEAAWREMAAGLREGDHGKHLITFHPAGAQSSSQRLHNEAWLDFNMLQSGHHKLDIDNYTMIEHDYQLTPVKPCIDGEPRYENHPINWKPENGWFNDFDVRQAAYWAVFAGAHGHTYGCHDIWQMKTPERAAMGSARGDWRESLHLPGSTQVGYVRRLMLSRPFLSRVPDQTLIVGGQSEGAGHVQATRGDDYAFIYTPLGNPVTVALGRIGGARVKAWWFDPRTGRASALGEFANRGTREFTPPGGRGRGHDWVLVLDNAQRDFAEPGATKEDR